MSLIKLVCPHCEQRVEVQATSVTRSRECPNCGKSLLLQVVEKGRKQKRRALLLPTEGGLPTDDLPSEPVRVEAKKPRQSEDAPAQENGKDEETVAEAKEAADDATAHLNGNEPGNAAEEVSSIGADAASGDVEAAPVIADEVAPPEADEAIAPAAEPAVAEEPQVADNPPAEDVIPEVAEASAKSPAAGKAGEIMTALPPVTESPAAAHTDAGGALDDKESHDNAAERRLFAGDPRHRMLHDPEVLGKVRMLVWGTGILLVLILASVMGDAMRRRPGGGGEPERHPVRTAPPEPVVKVAKPPAVENLAPVPLESAPLPDAGSSNLKLAEACLVSFLKAANVEDRLKYVRQRQAMEPKIRAYYKSEPPGPVAFERVEVAGDSDSSVMFEFAVILPGGARRSAYVGRTKGGGFAVDWPSFVALSDMGWSQFREAKPLVPQMFRVIAEPGNNYGGKFFDPKWLVCVRMTDPLHPQSPPILGYAQRNSPLGRALAFVLDRRGGAPSPVMVKLRYPEAADSPDQVWIDQLLGEGWLSREW